jgi:hypothetical protein
MDGTGLAAQGRGGSTVGWGDLVGGSLGGVDQKNRRSETDEKGKQKQNRWISKENSELYVIV